MKHSSGDRDDIPYWLHALALMAYVAAGFIISYTLVSLR